MKAIVQQLNRCILRKDRKDECQDLLVNYLLNSRHLNRTYATKYLVCELLNFLHLLLEIKFVDIFLGGQFLTYGTCILQMRQDPMARIFPKMAKCSFYQFGPSGDVQKYDNLCLLPLNVINEKVFLFIWFWFLILLLFTTMSLMCRVLLIVSKSFRRRTINKMSFVMNGSWQENIMQKCHFGDIFLLDMLSRNLDPIHFHDAIVQFSHKI